MESPDYSFIDIFREQPPENGVQLQLDPSFVFFVYDIRSARYLHLIGAIDTVLGYSKTVLLQKGINFFLSLIDPDDLNVLQDYYALFQSNVEKSSVESLHSKSLEFRIKHATGKWIWLESNLLYLSKRKNVLGILKDINVWKRKEEFYGKWIKEFLSHSGGLLESDHPDPSEMRMEMLKSNLRVSLREKEVLHLVADGYSAKQIADKLHISTHTAINHRKNLISKFQVKNTAELIKEASRFFWL